MSRGTQDILDRLSGVEPRPRWIDRDGRRTLGVIAALTVIMFALAARSRDTAEISAAEAAVKIDDPVGDPIGAIQRIRIEPGSAEKATSTPDDGYESIDAIGPGRRS